MVTGCNELWPAGFPGEDYPLLKGELDKAIEAGRHAFESGYRDAVNNVRGKPHNDAAAERFLDERYRFLNTFHPLVSHGFISRFGHYNHWARRNDWEAVSRDTLNLHLGACVPDKMTEALKDLAFYLKRRKDLAITLDTNFEFFHWPYILRVFDGIMEQVATVFPSKSALHVGVRKKGGRVSLDFKCGRKWRLNEKSHKTLMLVKEVVGYFGGEFEMNNDKPKFGISITLPYSIRVDDFYGGSYHEYQW